MLHLSQNYAYSAPRSIPPTGPERKAFIPLLLPHSLCHSPGAQGRGREGAWGGGSFWLGRGPCSASPRSWLQYQAVRLACAMSLARLLLNKALSTPLLASIGLGPWSLQNPADNLYDVYCTRQRLSRVSTCAAKFAAHVLTLFAYNTRPLAGKIQHACRCAKAHTHTYTLERSVINHRAQEA